MQKAGFLIVIGRDLMLVINIKIKTQDCICFVFCSIPLRFSFFDKYISKLSGPFPLCPILFTMHVLVMGLTQLICMFDLYTSLHSPFKPVIEKFILFI